MKKINEFDNKGFVIVETIIVAVFVIGICTFLFSNLVPLIGDYERISNYDDLSSKYKVHEIKKMILREIANSSDKKNIFTDYISNNSGYHQYKNQTNGDVKTNELCDRLNNKNYCNKLLGTSYLDVKEIVVVPFKLTTVKHEIKEDENISREVKEYIEYLPNYNKYSSIYDNYSRLIVVFNDGNIANIEVNYEEI